MRQQQRSARIDVEHGLDARTLARREVALETEPRVTHDQPQVTLADRRHDAIHCIGLGQIRNDQLDLQSAATAQLLRETLEAICAARNQQHVDAAAREQSRELLAYAGG